MRTAWLRFGLTCLLLAGCSRQLPDSAETPSEQAPPADASEPAATEPATTEPAASEPAATEPAQTGDAPEISRSVGEPGGLVILWPRIIPASTDGTMRARARVVQDRMAALARKTFPDRKIDVRPEPERVCPQDGCQGTSFGAVLGHEGEGCAVVALVSQPGRSPTRLVAWTEGVETKMTDVPFREHPESQLKVKNFQPCVSLNDSLAKQDERVVKALRELVK